METLAQQMNPIAIFDDVFDFMAGDV